MRVVQIEPGPMPTLTRVGAGLDQRLRRRRGGDVAADDVDLREVLLDPAHAVEHALVVAVRGVDHQHVDPGPDHQLGALLGVGAGADGAADPQLALLVLRRIRMLGGLGDVLHRDQAAQLVVTVDHEHPLETVLVHQRLGFVQACALAAP